VKPANQQPGGQITDGVTAHMLGKLQKIILRLNQPDAVRAIGEWQITEAWPPTVQHQSRCHFRGCALDIKLLGAVTKERIAAMDQVLRAFWNNRDLNYVRNEYTNPARYTTGGHFHIEAY
jgi:hypothetical protein